MIFEVLLLSILAEFACVLHEFILLFVLFITYQQFTPFRSLFQAVPQMIQTSDPNLIQDQLISIPTDILFYKI